MLLAHREEDLNGSISEQSLEDHLYATGKMAGEIGQSIGLESFMTLAAYLHDVGKSDRNFQHYIQGSKKQHINHSSAGAKVLYDYIEADEELREFKNRKGKFNYFLEVLSYIILGHHGLFDSINRDGMESNSHRRLRYDEEGDYHYLEDVVPFVQAMDRGLQELGKKSILIFIRDAYQEFIIIYDKLDVLANKNNNGENKKDEKEYYISCLMRLCLSILKEADIYDSANAFHVPKQHIWMEEGRNKVWEESVEKIEEMYLKYEMESNSSRLNETRNRLAALSKEAALRNRDGIFKLELPTGAGKTKAGLRYALANAKEFHRNQIFYITAFLSVLEQNAAEIRGIVKNDEVILEHHSNIVEDRKDELEEKEDDEYRHQTYLKESWEQLIILTTMVQFLNTLFKEKSSNIRRFCKLINSVIVIDEVQSLPLKILSNFNLMMNFMKEIMHCNIVHCTATQPVLDNSAMRYPIRYGNEEDRLAEIITLSTKEMQVFQRVDFYNLTGDDARTFITTKELTNRIQKELETFQSCLVVLNTKSAVTKLCDELEKTLLDCEIIYLTTNLCAAHRLELISKMKAKLVQSRKGKANQKIVCVSTQLIEAGVDVDFDVVFRSVAGVDSLVQCAGRCNREGKLQINGRNAKGKLYIIQYVEENLSNLPEIKASSNATEAALRSLGQEVLRETNKLKLEDLQASYYDKYYVNNQKFMDYINVKRKSNMVDELGLNQLVRADFHMVRSKERMPRLFQSFKTAAENFEVIQQGTTGVIVTYQNQELLDKLELAMGRKNYAEIKVLLHKLQRYTINIHLSDKLQPFICENKEYNVYFLGKEYYNGKRGVTTIELANLII